MTFTRLTALILLFFPFVISAQEREMPLRYNARAAQHYTDEQRFPQKSNRGGGGSLPIPFFDDFSRYSLPTNDPNIPDSWQRWADDNVFINCTFPLSPMTLGVATLDGLASDGTPYSDTLYFPTITDAYLDWGLADSLTSLPLDLSGHTPEDNVYLVFNFECGGLGNQPDADGVLGSVGDSLILEFYSPLQQGHWFRAWATEGGLQTSSFDTVFVPINDLIYLQDGFRFRFKNYCTLHGALDHWHLDYVIVNSNIIPSQFVYDEVSFQYCNNTLLNLGYTSMPWTHFQSNPSFYMADEFTFYQRNLGDSKNIATSWEITYDGVTQHTSTANTNTSSNGYSEIQRTVSLEDYVYDTPTIVDSASFEVCVSYNPTDIHQSNDTMCFTQSFTNYYAYDDGTAERAYGLQSAGGKVAMRFNSAIPDTLLGVYMYFIPVQYLATDQTFILQVWDDLSGTPSTILTTDFDNFNFHLPHYYAGGPNLFVYYPLIDPVYVDAGDFYVGYIQQNAVSLNNGLDKNTSMNSTKLFYQLQGQTTWVQSEILGSTMFRPVFKSGLPDWVNVEEKEIEISELYPNPTSGQLQFTMKPDYSRYDCRILDITGRVVSQQTITNTGQIDLDVSTLENASYLFQLTSLETHQSIVKHFAKN